MVYCASPHRRHPRWRIDGSLTCRSAPQRAWMSPVCPSTRFSSWCRPLRPRATRLCARGAAMGNPGPPVTFAGTKTAPYGLRKRGCSSSSRLCRPTPSRWCRGGCAVGRRGKPSRGAPGSCPCASRPCVPAALPPPVLCAPWPGAAASRRLTPLPSSAPWTRSRPRPFLHPAPYPRPPFGP
jgi:hypothetical protein